VVEGWHGVAYGKPLTRVREYISIIRQILARESRVELPELFTPYIEEGVKRAGNGGGMGARSKNFYNDYAKRLGFEEDAVRIQDLYLDGKRQEAVAAVPDALVDRVALVGPRERIRDRLDAWKESPVGTMCISGPPAAVPLMAELVL